MSAIKTNIGPFAAAYIGVAGQSAPLIQLNSVRTEGAEVSENLATEFLISIDGPVQSGNHIVSLTMTFIGTDDEVIKLVRGLSPAASSINAPVGQTQYAVFVAGADSAGKENYYFPQVRTEKSYKTVRSKKATTNTTVVFIGEKRSVLSQLMVKGTLAECASTMGSQNPL